jgi:hypothetical protein
VTECTWRATMNFLLHAERTCTSKVSTPFYNKKKDGKPAQMSAREILLCFFLLLEQNEALLFLAHVNLS